MDEEEMTNKMDEVDSETYPTKTAILATGENKKFPEEDGVEIELALEKERDVKKMFAGVSAQVSPFTSVASSDMSKESSDSGFSLSNAKFFVFTKLQQRKWQYALLGLILGLMILIAALAGSAANGNGTGQRTPFLVFFQSEHPTFSPTLAPTDSPSFTPTLRPSESPSQAPSIYDPPIKDPIQLRLYWESGYFWQESIFQTYWCAECADCPEYRLGDGVGPDFQNCTSPGDTTASCNEGNQLWLQSCKNTSRDYRFEFLHNDGSGFQIRAFNTSLCFSTVRNTYIEMRPCDSRRSSQLFNPIQFSTKFELRTYEERNLPVDEARCVSQLHHPKANEMIGLHRCDWAVNDTTNFWEQYP
ncbi:unnamed protein product [Cylindrotheca closterium]|uniref:Ricin B lectin domain-containing protein n=1 Tax=Cylindrotheca closterium TaxID=2856 RepID=A0AAD2CV94_9STRA|nr:unnamed protein product [Cylindrotheca closterium]